MIAAGFPIVSHPSRAVLQGYPRNLLSTGREMPGEECQEPTFTIEADEMDFGRCLEIQRPYLDPVAGYYTDWTPLKDRGVLFPEDVDTSDPWQF